MIKRVLVFSCLIVLSSIGIAQDVEVEDVCISMSKGSQCGISLKVPNIPKEDLVNRWEKKVKSQSQFTIKTNRVGNELQMLSAELKSIPERVNIYTLVYGHGAKSELIVFAESDQGFLTSENQKTEYLAVKKILQQFGSETAKDALDKSLKDEKRRVADLEKNLKKLQRKKDSNIRKIESEKRDIKELRERDIAEIEDEQEQVRKKIEERKAQKRGLDHKDMKAAAQKLIDEQVKKLEKLDRKKDRLKEKISRCEEDIRELEREVDQFDREMEQTKSMLQNREDKVGKLKNKLD